MSASATKTEPRQRPVVLPLRDARLDAALFRALDVGLSGLLLVVLSPLLLVIAIAIRADTPGPVFFRQRRCGIALSHFTITKFRTMYSDASAEPHREYVVGLLSADENGADGNGRLFKLEHDDRITRVGAFLRRFSLDELPQLWNILRGDMSLVGPRPAIPYELDFYRDDWYGRFAVKPGLTGLWQVSGRNELNFAEMVQIDLEYVRRRSIGANLRIIAKTGWVVLHGKGSA